MTLEENIKEKLSEYMKSDSLNPLLFNEEGILKGTLKEEIKDKILEIVEEFLKYADVDIPILDIRLVGSNAAYNYTKDSDLDIHIVTDLSEISDPETIARLYFDSIKKNFKDSYDITIKGIDVEIYVEDVNVSSMSNGIYSVSQMQWIKEPVATEAPTEEEEAEAARLEDEIINSLENAKNTEELQDIVNKLYLMRKDSLSSKGEVGAGNLAFKSLRNEGVLDLVKDILRKAKSKELSLESKSL